MSEDFKLSSGTWVSVGPLRSRILAHSDGYLQDVVISGHDRESAAALLFPNVPKCRALCPDLASDAPVRTVLDDPRVRERVRALLEALARASTGSSTFVRRAILLEEPPSVDARELTDKGSINQKAVLQNRSALVEELHAPVPSSRLLIMEAQPS